MAYLRAILLALNESSVPDGQSSPPFVWGGPPRRIVHVSNLLYASLLISLLSAFIAMLGKQWLNRYLRHVGGSTPERCGDRQRKLDGLEKWSFRLLVESLPMMLQISLLLLACGLSRYAWAVNTSVAALVIALTALTIVFYLVIVAAGTSSYDCPYQTPASLGLRALWHNKGIRKVFTKVSPPAVTRHIHTATVSITVTFGQFMHNFISEFSISGITLGIRRGGRILGHGVTRSLRSLDRGFRNIKRKLVQGVLGLKRVALPVHVDGLRPQSPPNTKLDLTPTNIGTLLEKNSNDAYCVCWIPRNITDPEAIDSALRLAATVRWFEDGVYANPPYDLIVSIFNSCFDSSWKLHPGMKDRAYLSGKAMLAIYVSALVNEPGRASRYTFSDYHIPLQSFPKDADLKSIMFLLWNLSYDYSPFLHFADSMNTPAHIIFMADLYLRCVWSQRDGLHPHSHGLLQSLTAEDVYWPTFPTGAVADILLAGCLLLAAPVEDIAVYITDKSSVFQHGFPVQDTHHFVWR